MEHQDWQPVMLRRHQSKKTVSPNLPPKERDFHEDGLDTRITSRLRTALIMARGARKRHDLFLESQQRGCRIKEKDMEDAETGRCTLKVGKQVALVYEKITRVKIL
tara:strand:- start:186 stop:503 length:318 start_codon:yes stop_codon:yes gene_type:complete